MKEPTQKKTRNCVVCADPFETDTDLVCCPKHSFGETAPDEAMQDLVWKYATTPPPKKDRPLCPQCKEPTIVLFTPPKKEMIGTDPTSPEYIDWNKAHLYCSNGYTNCDYRAGIMDRDKLTT